MKNNRVFSKMTALVMALMIVTIVASIGAGANSKSAPVAVKRSAMTELTQDQVEAGVEEYFASIGSLNVQRYTNNFAPDGTLEDPVGTPVVQGTAAISGYFGGIISPFTKIEPKIQEIVVCGHEAAVNWKLHLKTSTGKKVLIDGMGVFNFNQDGKLESVREFWDLQAFLAQLQS
jgi:steroid delta-isomerase